MFFDLGPIKFCYSIENLLKKNNFILYDIPTLKETFEDDSIISYSKSNLSKYEQLTNEIWQLLNVNLITKKYYFKCQYQELTAYNLFLEFSKICFLKLNQISYRYFETISRIESKKGDFISSSKSTVSGYDIPTFTSDGEESEGNVGNKTTTEFETSENHILLESEYIKKISILKERIINEIVNDGEYFIEEKYVEIFGKLDN